MLLRSVYTRSSRLVNVQLPCANLSSRDFVYSVGSLLLKGTHLYSGSCVSILCTLALCKHSQRRPARVQHDVKMLHGKNRGKQET